MFKKKGLTHMIENSEVFNVEQSYQEVFKLFNINAEEYDTSSQTTDDVDDSNNEDNDDDIYPDVKAEQETTQLLVCGKEIASLQAYLESMQALENDEEQQDIMCEGITNNIFLNIPSLRPHITTINDSVCGNLSSEEQTQTYLFLTEAVGNELNKKVNTISTRLESSVDKNVDKVDETLTTAQRNLSELNKKIDESGNKPINGTPATSVQAYITAGIMLVATTLVFFKGFKSLATIGAKAERDKMTIFKKLTSLKIPGKSLFGSDGKLLKLIKSPFAKKRTPQPAMVFKRLISSFKSLLEKTGTLIRQIRSGLQEMFQFKWLQNTLGKSMNNPYTAKRAGQLAVSGGAGYALKKGQEHAEKGTFGQTIKNVITNTIWLKSLLSGIQFIISMVNSILVFSVIGGAMRGTKPFVEKQPGKISKMLGKKPPKSSFVKSVFEDPLRR